jgi:hypothetical protein
MMTPAKWSEVLVNAVRGVGWAGAIYIVTLFLVGERHLNQDLASSSALRCAG